MDKKAVLRTIAAFRKSIESKGVRVERLILYGSWSRNQQVEGSDIDLVVISNDFIDKDYWERIDILTDAIYEVFAPIEAVAMTPEEWESESSEVCYYAKDGEVV